MIVKLGGENERADAGRSNPTCIATPNYQAGKFGFPVQSWIGNLTRLMPNLLNVMTIHNILKHNIFLKHCNSINTHTNASYRGGNRVPGTGRSERGRGRER